VRIVTMMLVCDFPQRRPCRPIPATVPQPLHISGHPAAYEQMEKTLFLDAVPVLICKL